MEAGVGWFGLSDGMKVEVNRRKAADVLVAHALASLEIVGLLEVDEWKLLRGRLQTFEFEGYTC